MRSLKKRGPHVLNDLNDLLFSLQISYCLNVYALCNKLTQFSIDRRYRLMIYAADDHAFTVVKSGRTK